MSGAAHAADSRPVDSATPGDTGTAPQDTGTVPDAEPDTAPPPPSCTFVVEPGATPCFWTTFFQVLPATCVSSGESVQAECATLCGTNANGETPDRCYVGSGASVDCYVDDECGDPGGPGGPGGPGPGGP